MDVWRILTAALRRWYVLVPLLVLTGFASTTVHISDVEYQSTGTIIILPASFAPQVPDTRTQPVPNPFAAGTVAGGAVAAKVESSAAREAMAQRGFSPDYDLKTDRTTGLTTITARSTSDEQAITTGKEVIVQVKQELERLQADAGVPNYRSLGISVLDEVDSVAPSATGRSQQIAVIAAIGTALSFLLAVMFDDVMILVRRRRDRRSAPDSDHSPESAQLTDSSPLAESMPMANSMPLASSVSATDVLPAVATGPSPRPRARHGTVAGMGPSQGNGSIGS